MLTFDFAKPSDVPALKRLWKSVFGDTNRYIEQYFNSLFPLIRVAVARTERGRPVSMLSMLPVSFRADTTDYPGHYIYAAATHRRYEGRGIMTGLLTFACDDAAERGECFSSLIPASASLFGFYEKRGYQTVFYRDILQAASAEKRPKPPEWTISRMSRDDFLRLRQVFVEKLPVCMMQDPLLYPYIYEELLESGTDILLVQGNGKSGYVVCYAIDSFLAVKETSFSKQELSAVLPLLEERMNCHGAAAAFPPLGTAATGGKCKRTAYGMLRPLAGRIPADIMEKNAYMGLLMD